MAKIEDVVNDLKTIKQATGDYIAARDAIDADLKNQIAALTAQLGVDAAAVDEAFQLAEAAKAAIAPPVPAPTPAP